MPPSCSPGEDSVSVAQPALLLPAGLRDQVRGTNICEATLLATDYLNHFIEVIMLIEMLPDMPDLFEEAKGWHPKTYVEYFRDSSWPFRDLAIAMYAAAPIASREAFEITVGQLEAVIDATLRHAAHALERQDPHMLRDRVAFALAPMRRLVEVASGIIHGSRRVLSQAEIDSVITD